MKNVMKTIGVIFAVILLSCGAVYAGTSYTVYNVVVGRFNGNVYTYSQEKSVSGTAGMLNSQFVGGSYVVDARMEGTYVAPWIRDVTDNDFRALTGYYKLTAGMDIRVHFSNDWNTPVAVQLIGTWKSN